MLRQHCIGSPSRVPYENYGSPGTLNHAVFRFLGTAQCRIAEKQQAARLRPDSASQRIKE